MNIDNLKKHFEVLDFINSNTLNNLLSNRSAGSTNDFLKQHEWKKIQDTNMYGLVYEDSGKYYISKIYITDDDLGVESSKLYGGRKTKICKDNLISESLPSDEFCEEYGGKRKYKKRAMPGTTGTTAPTGTTRSPGTTRLGTTGLTGTEGQTGTQGMMQKSTSQRKTRKNKLDTSDNYTSDLMGITHKIK